MRSIATRHSFGIPCFPKSCVRVSWSFVNYVCLVTKGWSIAEHIRKSKGKRKEGEYRAKPQGACGMSQEFGFAAQFSTSQAMSNCEKNKKNKRMEARCQPWDINTKTRDNISPFPKRKTRSPLGRLEPLKSMARKCPVVMSKMKDKMGGEEEGKEWEWKAFWKKKTKHR